MSFTVVYNYLIASRIPPGRVVQSIGDRSKTAQEHSQDSLKTAEKFFENLGCIVCTFCVFCFHLFLSARSILGQTGHHQRHRNCKQINESNQRIESTNPFDESHQEIECMN